MYVYLSLLHSLFPLTCDPQFPGTGVSFREFTGIIVLLIGAVNFLHAFHVILTRGAGHNGSTVAVRSSVPPVKTAKGSRNHVLSMAPSVKSPI